jgi:hypothetical protein
MRGNVRIDQDSIAIEAQDAACHLDLEDGHLQKPRRLRLFVV